MRTADWVEEVSYRITKAEEDIIAYIAGKWVERIPNSCI
jgi:hypothetical protein